jgi:ABC-type multidrug transport system ATPase subunit
VADIYRQIEPFKKRRAGKLSGGMKQKLALSCALIHKPKVLFLDEPTTGVDPVSRKEFWEMLRKLKNQGITILVSTPYMDEAKLCERIALMQEGNILSIEKPEAIIEKFGKTLFAVSSNNMYKLLNDLREYPFTKHCFGFGDHHHVTLTDETKGAEDIQAFLAERGNEQVIIDVIDPGIEDCFMELMTN